MKYLAGACLAVFLFFPSVASAQFVPVRDIQLNASFTNFLNQFIAYRANFTTFSNNFTAYSNMWRQVMVTNTDSVRQMLAGNPDTERLYMPDKNWAPENGSLTLPAKRCTPRPTVDRAYAWPAVAPPGINSPWRRAFDGGYVPRLDETAAPGVIEVNSSVSLSCLLQEVVEWQKLSLFLNIHSLLLEYISNAQETQLAGKLSSAVSAAYIAQARQGETREVLDTTTGITTISTLSIAGEQPDQYSLMYGKARANLIGERIMGDPTSPAGFTGTADPFKQFVAEGTANDALNYTEDGLDTMQLLTQHTLTNPLSPMDAPIANENDFDAKIIQDCSLSVGGCLTALSFLNNSANSPQKALGQMRALQARQVEDVKGQVDAEYVAGGGIYPDKDRAVANIKADPTGDIRFAKNVTPSVVQEKALVDSTSLGTKMTMEMTGANSQPPDTLENQSTDLATAGLSAYDVTPMQKYDPQVDALVGSLYDTISWGYFDNQYGTRHWAQAAMLSIYDQMQFSNDLTSPTQPNVIVPNATTPANETDLYNVYR